MTNYEKLMKYNRHPELSNWFKIQLSLLEKEGYYADNAQNILEHIISNLESYRFSHKINQVFIGMSGGIDSTLTASLFKNAGYYVNGVIIPIEQNPEETERAIEACESLEIQYRLIDLTDLYKTVKNGFTEVDPFIHLNTEREAKRRGNIKARLRMMALYNMASNNGGLVASTDNFSELAAGFWTLHGDVGDVAPIQSLTKSWEVPLIAEELGLPQSIIKAVPTDGLGISESDEDQLGVSYLEFDIVLLNMIHKNFQKTSDISTTDRVKLDLIQERLIKTAYKRKNPYNLEHPLYVNRFELLDQLDIYGPEEFSPRIFGLKAV